MISRLIWDIKTQRILYANLKVVLEWPHLSIEKSTKVTDYSRWSYIDTLVSGSPLIQNGKLIGAVTHVLVNDPTRGYGIFIENMLETANQVAEEQAKKDAS